MLQLRLKNKIKKQTQKQNSSNNKTHKIKRGGGTTKKNPERRVWEGIFRKYWTENIAKGLSGEYEKFLDVDTMEINDLILARGKIEQEKVGGYLWAHPKSCWSQWLLK